MSFRFPQKMMFKHCDPAGIGFYPRFFEIVNDCIETFFGAEVGTPFEQMHKGDDGGVPTVKISAEFPAPSRHGDQLVLTLDVTHIGHTSLGLAIVARAGEEVRMRVASTLVHIDGKGRPLAWNEGQLAGLRAHLKRDANAA
jgi:4-hydroxybenzoyl-CoA thioesterase